MLRRTFLSLTLVAAALPALAGEPMPRFTFPSADGGQIDTADWAGHTVLVTNTASLCGFAPQLETLQDLHEELGPKGLIVIAVPSNDFDQELATAKEAKSYCALNFGLDLPMTDILHVAKGDVHPFYAWLRDTEDFTPSWNFNKVLIGPDGRVVGTYGAFVKPTSASLRNAIDSLMPQG